MSNNGNNPTGTDNDYLFENQPASGEGDAKTDADFGFAEFPSPAGPAAPEPSSQRPAFEPPAEEEFETSGRPQSLGGEEAFAVPEIDEDDAFAPAVEDPMAGRAPRRGRAEVIDHEPASGFLGEEETEDGDDTVVEQIGDDDEIEEVAPTRSRLSVSSLGIYAVIAVVLLGGGYYAYTNVIGPIFPSGGESPAVVRPANGYDLPANGANTTPTLPGRPTLPNVPATVSTTDLPATANSDQTSLPGLDTAPAPVAPASTQDVTSTKVQPLAPALGTMSPDQSALDDRLTKLEQEVAALTSANVAGQIADLSARLASLENQPAVTGTPAPMVQPPSKPQVIDGWTLKGVAGDVAWVQNTGGDFLEVRVGTDIPNGGTVQQISRYEDKWLVVTTMGVILAGK